MGRTTLCSTSSYNLLKSDMEKAREAEKTGVGRQAVSIHKSKKTKEKKTCLTSYFMNVSPLTLPDIGPSKCPPVHWLPVESPDSHIKHRLLSIQGRQRQICLLTCPNSAFACAKCQHIKHALSGFALYPVKITSCSPASLLVTCLPTTSTLGNVLKPIFRVVTDL